ncbi:MAG: DNA double-strand break repair nuclease NurA [Chloroflexi bacterium]|nr:DNA double-strand break repair nuclease NurA [Chloroflexota bacterium]
MSLDFGQVAGQITGMVDKIGDNKQTFERRLKYAVELLKTTDYKELQPKMERSRAKNSLLMAGIIDSPALTHVPAPCPTDYSVIATDGSSIDVDRHVPVRCCLINIGSVMLSYGNNPDAVLTSEATLYTYEDYELMEGPLFGVKRAIKECQELAALLKDPKLKQPALGLLDGSLILWGLTGKVYSEYVAGDMLNNDFIPALNQIKKVGIPIASYISYPRSTDVVNTLRLVVCPYSWPDCERECKISEKKCVDLDGLTDRDLFENLLSIGERSSVFINRSHIVEKYYSEHKIYFFYLRIDSEIARIEIPEWVAVKAEYLELVHTIILDQCARGLEYPVALAEAHEKAVINSADNNLFWNIVEAAMTEQGLTFNTSLKSLNKRLRWV